MDLDANTSVRHVERLHGTQVGRQRDRLASRSAGHQRLHLAHTELTVEVRFRELDEGRNNRGQISASQLIGDGLLQGGVVVDHLDLSLPNAERGKVRVAEHAPNMHGIHHELVQRDAGFLAIRLHELSIEASRVLQFAGAGLAEAAKLGSTFEVRGMVERPLLDQVIPVHEVFGFHRFTFTLAGDVLGSAR